VNLEKHNVTEDSLFDGDLILFQNKSGYRFSIDSVLIAHFLKLHIGDRILDMGTGCGVIALILLYRWASLVEEVSGIELQASLAKLAQANYHSNNFSNHGKIIEKDIKNILDAVAPESYDKVICNPPFYSCSSGRMSANKEANMARHHVLASLLDFLKASASVVKNRGDVFFIYPAESIAECIIFAQKVRLELKRIRFVYGYPHKINMSRLVLLQFKINGAAGSEVLPPLYIYHEKNGSFSKEMQRFYQPQAGK
jgi:tRNA1(Val) A37 N6-methylase TrmN6